MGCENCNSSCVTAVVVLCCGAGWTSATRGHSASARSGVSTHPPPAAPPAESPVKPIAASQPRLPPVSGPTLSGPNATACGPPP